MILLNPGPVTLSPRVRAALQREDLCHREPEFAALTREVCRRLEHVYPEAAADYAAVLLTGSGSAAVEAMLSTFAPADRTTLVVCNGVYGERMVQMLARQRKPCATVQGAWESDVDLDAVAAALDARPDTATLAVVHHETTTGRLNRLDGVAALCRARGVGLLVDAVSSFGAEDIAFDRWQPLAVAATANKCLHGVAGISFVLGRREVLAQANGYATALYLDLERYHAVQREGWSPFTQAVQVMQALAEALREFEDEGGWQVRRGRYLQRSNAIGACLAAHGIETLLAPQASASMLRAYRLPQGLPYSALHDSLKREGFTIYAGQGRLAEGIFRIATMGCISGDDLRRLLGALPLSLLSPHDA